MTPDTRRPAPKWHEMTPIQKGVVIVVLGCAAALLLTGTAVACRALWAATG